MARQDQATRSDQTRRNREWRLDCLSRNEIVLAVRKTAFALRNRRCFLA